MMDGRTIWDARGMALTIEQWSARIEDALADSGGSEAIFNIDPAQPLDSQASSCRINGSSHGCNAVSDSDYLVGMKDII